MPTLLFAALNAIRSLFAPGMFSIMILSVIATVCALSGFVIGASVFFNWLAEQMQYSAFADWLPWAGSIGSLFLAWLLFPGIMPIIVNFFGESIASIIEREDYPAARPAHTSNFWKEFWHDAGFSVTAIMLNILVLPLYLLPIINIFLFYLLNGYLLGREFFVMVGRRHIGPEQAAALRKRHGRVITLTGALLTLLATIPIINLIAPFWGIAAMTHLYHRLAQTPSSQILPPA